MLCTHEAIQSALSASDTQNHMFNKHAVMQSALFVSDSHGCCRSI